LQFRVPRPRRVATYFALGALVVGPILWVASGNDAYPLGTRVAAFVAALASPVVLVGALRVAVARTPAVECEHDFMIVRTETGARQVRWCDIAEIEGPPRKPSRYVHQDTITILKKDGKRLSILPVHTVDMESATRALQGCWRLLR
jgi:hypothetical protein